MNTVGLMWPPMEPRSDLPFSSSEPGGTVTGAPLLVMTEAVPWVASDSSAAAIPAGLPVVSREWVANEDWPKKQARTGRPFCRARGEPSGRVPVNVTATTAPRPPPRRRRPGSSRVFRSLRVRRAD